MKHAPAYWSTACAELAAADPVMAALIAAYPDCVLGTRGDPFETLARAIVGQQISVKAADSIWARFTATVDANYSIMVPTARCSIFTPSRTRSPRHSAGASI